MMYEFTDGYELNMGATSKTPHFPLPDLSFFPSLKIGKPDDGCLITKKLQSNALVPLGHCVDRYDVNH